MMTSVVCCSVMEGRLLANLFEVLTVLNSNLDALFVLFPLLAASILSLLLAFELALFAAMETLLVTMFLFHHGTVGIILALLLLLFLTAFSFAVITASLLILTLALLVGHRLLLV